MLYIVKDYIGVALTSRSYVGVKYLDQDIPCHNELKVMNACCITALH